MDESLFVADVKKIKRNKKIFWWKNLRGRNGWGYPSADQGLASLVGCPCLFLPWDGDFLSLKLHPCILSDERSLINNVYTIAIVWNLSELNLTAVYQSQTVVAPPINWAFCQTRGQLTDTALSNICRASQSSWFPITLDFLKKPFKPVYIITPKKSKSCKNLIASWYILY